MQHSLDLQCSTDDDEDDEEDFQEVSEDENNAANILDQGERINATSSENMDFIDPKNIKTELDIEAQQMAGGLDYDESCYRERLREKESDVLHTGQLSFSLI